MFFVTSRSLLEKKGWVNPKTSFVPNGVDYRAFATNKMSHPSSLLCLVHE